MPRPESWDPEQDELTEDWSDYREEDLRGTLRLAVITEEKFGDPEKAAHMAERYAESLGGDAILERHAHQNHNH